MADWREDIREGFRLLGEAIGVAIESGENRAEVYPGQVRGLLRLVVGVERGQRKFKGRVCPGEDVRVFDELSKVATTGKALQLWCPYGYEMVKVETLDGTVDWYPVGNCTVL